MEEKTIPSNFEAKLWNLFRKGKITKGDLIDIHNTTTGDFLLWRFWEGIKGIVALIRLK
jgi:hypothetical protein